MQDSDFKKIIDALPIGFAHFKIIFNDLNKPVDYLFIEVNPTFEQITGLKADYVIGKTIRESIQVNEKTDFDWISFSEKISLGDNKTFELFSVTFHQYYQISVVTHEFGFITTLVNIVLSGQDISRNDYLAQKQQQALYLSSII